MPRMSANCCVAWKPVPMPASCAMPGAPSSRATIRSASMRRWTAAYYEGLTLRAQPLEDTVGAPFRRLMASLIDRINLVWLLRYRFNYNLPPAQVYYLLVGSRYSLPGARLQELAALDSLEAVLAALPRVWRTPLSGAADIPGVFARMERSAAEQAQQGAAFPRTRDCARLRLPDSARARSACTCGRSCAAAIWVCRRRHPAGHAARTRRQA